MAPDAVVRLVERAGEVRARVGESEAFAPSQVITRKFPGRHSMHGGLAQRHELHVIQLARRAEQHAPLLRLPPRRSMRGPCRIAQRKVELVGVRRFVLLPAGHRLRKGEFSRRVRYRATQDRSKGEAQGNAIECRRDIRLVSVHRLALDEKSLDGVERCQFVVATFQLADLGRDAEQRGQEVLEMRCNGNQECRLVLARACRWRGACRLQPQCKICIGGLEVSDEQRVDLGSTRDGIQIGETKALGKREC